MATNAIFFGWKRSLPGREAMSAEHFTQFLAYLNGLKAASMVSEVQPVFLTAHGGDLGGFILIHGKAENLHALVETPAWVEHMTRALMHLDGMGAVMAYTGAEVMNFMQGWTKAIPKH